MKLDHPHILRIQDAGLENHYPFIVTNHISTSTLRQMYLRGSRQPLTNVLPYLKQIADALQYAHDQKILHRDIRLENIRLDENDQILLQGFTIEAITQNRERLKYQRANVMDETFAYTAPEQIHGNAQPASDQYSLAIVIYELLSGALPFTGSYLEVADKQIKMSPPPLRQSVPNIPVRIENAIMKALAKDPTQRFPDIQSFISVLEQEHNASSRAVARRRPLPPPVAPRPIGASTASSSAPPPANPPAQQRISPTEAAVPPLPAVAGSANAAQEPADVVPQSPVPPYNRLRHQSYRSKRLRIAHWRHGAEPRQ
jgi:serine/threonine protein kinase